MPTYESETRQERYRREAEADARMMRAVVKMRAEFEAWAGQYGYSLERDHETGGYYADGADLAWSAWQASRAALAVELPDSRSLSASDDPWSVRDWCKDAIESAGVRVKE